MNLYVNPICLSKYIAGLTFYVCILVKYIIYEINVSLPMIIITLYNIGKIDFSEAEVIPS